MASSSLLSLLLLSLLSIGANARPGVLFHPCKTLFISYTISSSSSSNPNPTLQISEITTSINGEITTSADPEIATTSNHKPYTSFSVYRIIRPFRPYHPSSLPHLSRPIPIERSHLSPHKLIPKEPSFRMSSLRDRAMDILAVVTGLLFGVVCGALISTAIYLVWSLVANRYKICGSGEYDDGDDELEYESPKKMGYIMVAETAPAKEGYEGK